MHPLPVSIDVHLPRTPSARGATKYCKIIRSVPRNRVWGGWDFDGDIFPPGAVVHAADIPAAGLVLECAGPIGNGWGHHRRETLYILWRWDGSVWCELARASSVDRDWTLDLGPIAKRALHPPRPVLIDPLAAASRVLSAIEQELEPLDRQAQRLVLLAVYDAVASRVVA